MQKHYKRLSNLIGFFSSLQLSEYFFRSLGNSGNEPRRRSQCRNDHLLGNEGVVREHDVTTHKEESRVMGGQNFQKAVDFQEQEMVTETDEGVSLDNSESFHKNRESTIGQVPVGPIATNTHNSLLHQQSERVTYVASFSYHFASITNELSLNLIAKIAYFNPFFFI